MHARALIVDAAPVLILHIDTTCVSRCLVYSLLFLASLWTLETSSLENALRGRGPGAPGGCPQSPESGRAPERGGRGWGDPVACRWRGRGLAPWHAARARRGQVRLAVVVGPSFSGRLVVASNE